MTSVSIFCCLILLLFRHQAIGAHIVIDPGHGGVDHGAVYGLADESEVTLKVSQKLKTLLEKKYLHKVSMTRTDDTYIPLNDRVKVSEQLQADLFVSLHANASQDAKVKGIEFYFQNTWNDQEDDLQRALESAELDQANPNEKSNSSLSKKSLVQSIIMDLQRQNRIYQSLELSKILNFNLPGHIKQGPFYVLMRTSIPSVLVELGFLSHPKESQLLISTEHQNQLANKLAASIDTYLSARVLSADAIESKKK